MIAILDYGLGNVNSIKNMLSKISIESKVTCDAEDVKSADRLILPGVGSFDAGMTALGESGLIPVIKERVLENRVPVLGICLGAQLLTSRSEEGELPGLGWIEANTVRFAESDFSEPLAIPHMGWTDTNFNQSSNLITNYQVNDPRFYFVHSYHIKTARPEDVLATANYGHEFTAAVCRGNIVGAQFHPEKSHKYGMEFLRCFSQFTTADTRASGSTE